MAATLRPTVILCKDFSDSYRDVFEGRGFIPHFLQVLDTFFVNEPQLKDLIRRGPDEEQIGGVIVTSSRAAEAWVSCVKELENQNMDDGSTTISWSDIPFFVVGNATSKAFNTELSSPLLPASSSILGAQESGTGEALSKFIVSYFQKIHIEAETSERELKLSLPSNTSLLYLVGDKNKETIPDALGAAGLSYRKLQVYETRTILNLQEKLTDTLRRARSSNHEIAVGDARQGTQGEMVSPIWLVLFSPSSSESILSSLSSLGDSSINNTSLGDSVELPKAHLRASITVSVDGDLVKLRVAAIGPTTSKYLRNVLGPDFDIITSPKPDPNALADRLSGCIA